MQISIRAPVKGAIYLFHAGAKIAFISIRAPVKGAIAIDAPGKKYLIVFQSAHP